MEHKYSNFKNKIVVWLSYIYPPYMLTHSIDLVIRAHNNSFILPMSSMFRLRKDEKSRLFLCRKIAFSWILILTYWIGSSNWIVSIRMENSIRYWILTFIAKCVFQSNKRFFLFSVECIENSSYLKWISYQWMYTTHHIMNVWITTTVPYVSISHCKKKIVNPTLSKSRMLLSMFYYYKTQILI